MIQDTFNGGQITPAVKTARQKTGLGANIFGSILSTGAQMLENHFNRRWQEKQQDKAWKRNLEMWDMQNAYNTPQAQKARLLAAGLNPALMYGNGLAASGNSSSSPTAMAAQYTPTSSTGHLLNQSFGNAIQAGLARSQINAQKVTNRYTYAQTQAAYQALENAKLDGEVKRIVMPYVEQYEASKIASNYSTIGLNNARVNQINQELERILPARLRIMNATASQVQTSIRQMEATIENIGLRNKLTQKQIDFFKADKMFNYITDGLGTIFDGVGTFMNPFKGYRPRGSYSGYPRYNSPGQWGGITTTEFY